MGNTTIIIEIVKGVGLKVCNIDVKLDLWIKKYKGKTEMSIFSGGDIQIWVKGKHIYEMATNEEFAAAYFHKTVDEVKAWADKYRKV